MTTPLVLKTTAAAWVYNGTTAQSVTSITRSGSTATVTQTTHTHATNDVVTIAGADQTEYNITASITVTGNDTYTYTVSGTPATPATGTITSTALLKKITDADYPATTVPGIVYLDGTYYVMESDGTISGSDIDDPFAWDALNFINAEVEVDGGVAVAKYLNYLVAFGVWSTEVFYDAANATGSPLQRVDNAFMNIGCAHARSIVMTDNTLVWMAQAKEGESGVSAGRHIVAMSGFTTNPISTAFIDRILNGDDLSTVYSFAFRHNGHSFYVLTLVQSNITLVYDFTAGLWYQWSSMTAQASKSVLSLTYSTTTELATASVTTHGYADGDVVVIAGASPSAYNGTFNINYVDANTFTYLPASAPATTPATGTITAVGYTESYWKVVMHTVVNSTNMFLHESNGKLYQMLEDSYDDAGVHINFLVRTTTIDAKTNDQKKIARLELVGDKITGNALMRYSKDDYQTFSAYRSVDLSLDRCKLDRIGRARRASFDIRITDAIPVRLERLDITFDDDK